MIIHALRFIALAVCLHVCVLWRTLAVFSSVAHIHNADVLSYTSLSAGSPVVLSAGLSG